MSDATTAPGPDTGPDPSPAQAPSLGPLAPADRSGPDAPRPCFVDAALTAGSRSLSFVATSRHSSISGQSFPGMASSGMASSGMSQRRASPASMWLPSGALSRRDTWSDAASPMAPGTRRSSSHAAADSVTSAPPSSVPSLRSVPATPLAAGGDQASFSSTGRDPSGWSPPAAPPKRAKSRKGKPRRPYGGSTSSSDRERSLALQQAQQQAHGFPAPPGMEAPAPPLTPNSLAPSARAAPPLWCPPPPPAPPQRGSDLSTWSGTSSRNDTAAPSLTLSTRSVPECEPLPPPPYPQQRPPVVRTFAAEALAHREAQRRRAAELTVLDGRRPTQLIVNYLAAGVTEHELLALFAQVAPVAQCRVVFDKRTRRSKGYGFVYYTDPTSAEEALRLSGSRVRGKDIKVSFAEPQRPLDLALDLSTDAPPSADPDVALDAPSAPGSPTP